MNGPVALVTRAEEDGLALTVALRARGFEVRHAAAVCREHDPAAWAQALAHGQPELLLLTSPATAEIVAAGPPLPSGLRIAVVGPSTAARARQLGLPVHHQPAVATALDLARSLGPVVGVNVLYPRAEQVGGEALEALQAAGARLHAPVVYRNVEPAGFVEALRAALPVALITVLSGSAARRVAGAGALVASVPVVTIGPNTTREAREAGLTVVATASTPSAEGVAEAAATWWTNAERREP